MEIDLQSFIPIKTVQDFSVKPSANSTNQKISGNWVPRLLYFSTSNSILSFYVMGTVAMSVRSRENFDGIAEEINFTNREHEKQSSLPWDD